VGSTLSGESDDGHPHVLRNWQNAEQIIGMPAAPEFWNDEAIQDRASELLNVPVVMDSESIAADKTAQFNELVQNLSPAQLNKVKETLEADIANYDPMVMGSYSLAPEFLNLINQRLSTQTQ